MRLAASLVPHEQDRRHHYRGGGGSTIIRRRVAVVVVVCRVPFLPCPPPPTPPPPPPPRERFHRLFDRRALFVPKLILVSYHSVLDDSSFDLNPALVSRCRYSLCLLWWCIGNASPKLDTSFIWSWGLASPLNLLLSVTLAAHHWEELLRKVQLRNARQIWCRLSRQLSPHQRDERYEWRHCERRRRRRW